MKSVVLLFALLSATAFAQTSRSQLKVKTQYEPTYSSDSQAHGLRINYSRSQYEMKIETGPGVHVEGDDSRNMSYVNKIGVGYAYLPIGSLGFIGDFNYIELNLQSHSANIVRPEANAAYAFNRYVNVHGGLNLSRWVSAGAGDASSEIGYQVGVGGQLNQTLGAELNYTISKIGLSDSSSAEFVFKGIDLNLVATF